MLNLKVFLYLYGRLFFSLNDIERKIVIENNEETLLVRKLEK